MEIIKIKISNRRIKSLKWKQGSGWEEALVRKKFKFEKNRCKGKQNYNVN